MNWDWLGRNSSEITSWTLQHVMLAGLPTLIGLLLSIPIGAIANRYRWLYPPTVTVAGLLYTIPSIALFVLLPGIRGGSIIDPTNVIIALSLYTIALMVRSVADALASVPPDVRDSAIAMGYRPARRLLTVELPIAIPVIGAGLRVAAMSNVSLVAVAALIGVPQLGQLFTKGLQMNFYTPIVAGIVLCIAIAVVFDAVILTAIRMTTPWRKTVSA